MNSRQPNAASQEQPPSLTVGVNEAAAMLSIGRNLVYNLISEGRLKVIKLGRRTLITTASINLLLEDA